MIFLIEDPIEESFFEDVLDEEDIMLNILLIKDSFF